MTSSYTILEVTIITLVPLIPKGGSGYRGHIDSTLAKIVACGSDDKNYYTSSANAEG